jgi:ferredoxin
MSHHTVRGAYGSLADRLNRFPQGAPPTALLFRILSLLFTEPEADLVSRLPIKPFTVEDASRAWGRPPGETRRALDTLADKGLLLDVAEQAGTRYVLPPPMAGFFEFSLMRVREDVDQRVLSELFYEYLNVEEDFVKALFAVGETRLGRVFVDERAVPPALSLQVLDHERASEVVETASAIAVGVCYCRHKMQHVGRACAAPQDVCLTFNGVARSLARHGVARAIDAAECHDVLARSREQHLVQFGENVRERVSFICNCCGCCCEALLAARRFGFLHPVHTTGFEPALDTSACNGCGKCVAACPVDALSLVSAHHPTRAARKTVEFDRERCLGCGVCVGVCPKHSLALARRPERVLTPLDSTHRVVLMAIERGCLQDLIFDNRALYSHRAMAAVLGVILRLPPVKRAMASEQVRSRYLEALIGRAN